MKTGIDFAIVQESVCNVVLYHAVFVILWSQHQRRYETFCVY